MAVQAGDKIPSVNIKTMGPEGAPTDINTADALGTGKVVLFAVPGAFTPGCSKVHLPGFVTRAAELTAKGVDTIACISVNDAWVMQAWADSQDVGDSIVMLADGNGDFAAAMGLVMDGAGIGLGSRSRRYAAVIEDGVITHLDVEAPGQMSVSTCDAVLDRV